jgi:hypothetical protein
MAKCEVIALMELKTRLPAKLLPLVEEYPEKLEKLSATKGHGSSSRRGMMREGPSEGAEDRGGGAESPGSLSLSGGRRGP